MRDLSNFGFKLNSYDSCVANEIVCGFMMTVAWHMYDLKISYRDTTEIDQLINYLKG